MKKQGRTKRIILGCLLPLFFGSFLFVTWGVAQSYFIEGKDILRFGHDPSIVLGILKGIVACIGSILILTLFAAFASGIQSIVTSFLIEYVINPKIENNLIALFICGSLGLVSGILADWIINERSLIPIGGLTGVIVGKILRRDYNRSPETES